MSFTINLDVKVNTMTAMLSREMVDSTLVVETGRDEECGIGHMTASYVDDKRSFTS